MVFECEKPGSNDQNQGLKVFQMSIAGPADIRSGKECEDILGGFGKTPKRQPILICGRYALGKVVS